MQTCFDCLDRLLWRCNACRLTLSLQKLTLDSNVFVGPLPSQLGLLQDLDSVSLRGTNVSCVPLSAYSSIPHSIADNASNSSNSSDEEDTAHTHLRLDQTYSCSDAELLPCFLTFSEHQVPRTDSTKMACPDVVRLPHEQAVAACSGAAPWQLGVLAGGVAVTQTARAQSWDVEPRYFQYRKCTCLKLCVPDR